MSSNLGELRKAIAPFMGQFPDDFKRFVGILESEYRNIQELLVGVSDYSDIRHLQGQAYLLRKIIDVLTREEKK